MLSNLKTALGNKGITIRGYAKFLGVSEKTIQNKIAGTTAFTYPEVKKPSVTYCRNTKPIICFMTAQTSRKWDNKEGGKEMKEINPYGLYSRNDLAEIFEVTPRTISAYYKGGKGMTPLPKKVGVRGNSTTGRQLIDWLENGGTESKVTEPKNTKLLKFRQANGL